MLAVLQKQQWMWISMTRRNIFRTCCLSRDIFLILGVDPEEILSIKVKKMLFKELEEIEKYDGIWACSSILHLPKRELKAVFEKMVKALKKDGIIYTSFKYGDFEGERNGRYFTDFTEEKFNEFVQDIENVKLKEEWITCDVRPGRGEEKWLNLILQKN